MKHLPKKFSQVVQMFTKQSKRNEGYSMHQLRPKGIYDTSHGILKRCCPMVLKRFLISICERTELKASLLLSPPFLAFSSPPHCHSIRNKRTFSLKKAAPTRVLYTLVTGSYTHFGNCKYTTSLCFRLKCIRLTSIALLLISYPNPFFDRRLGCGRCPFHPTMVKLSRRLFMKRTQRSS